MDYCDLAKTINTSVSSWTTHQVFKWLTFIHLDQLIPHFQSNHVDGQALLQIKVQHLQSMGILQNITKKKLMNWITQGLVMFEQYLHHQALKQNIHHQANKENIQPNSQNQALPKDQQKHKVHSNQRVYSTISMLNQSNTNMVNHSNTNMVNHSNTGMVNHSNTGMIKAMRQSTHMREKVSKNNTNQNSCNLSCEAQDCEMIVRSYEGSQAAFYVMASKSLLFGRNSNNTIRSLQISIEDEHASIEKCNDKYFLRDLSTEAGTFIKIAHRQKLELDTLIEMGSFLMKVTSLDRALKSIAFHIHHMLSKENGELVITLQNKCSFYSFGRRKTNNFSFEDEHLSGTHAKIFFLSGQFEIEDLHSTNGTWLRLSEPHVESKPFEVSDGTIFKVGTTITYTLEKKVKQDQCDRVETETRPHCGRCLTQEKNILFLPCRHNILCENCSQNVDICESCNNYIKEKIKIFV